MIVELDGVGVRALVKVTGAQPGTVGIGDRGRMALRRVAVRSGVPDYGYAFEPEAVSSPQSSPYPSGGRYPHRSDPRGAA